jgi:hypothetical protein
MRRAHGINVFLLARRVHAARDRCRRRISNFSLDFLSSRIRRSASDEGVNRKSTTSRLHFDKGCANKSHVFVRPNHVARS